MIWLGTANGLVRFNPLADTAFFFSENAKTSDKYLGSINQPIHAMAQTSDSCIWLGTMGNGLMMLDLKADSLYSFLSIANDSTSISSNNIIDILIDKDRSGIYKNGCREVGISGKLQRL